MADPVTMAMVGAAIGGGGSLLSGKSLGTSLKNAALGGTLGYGGGALLGSAGAGAATTAGTTASTGAGLSQGAGGLLGATGSAAGGTASLAPTVVGGSGALTANTMIPYSAEIGMANSFNPITGVPLTTEASSFAPAMFANAPNAGGLTALNSGVAAPATFDTMFAGVKDFADKYGTLDNLKGAAQVASMYQPQPMQMGGGRIEVGQAPTGAIYDALRQAGYTLPKRRETNLGLIG